MKQHYFSTSVLIGIFVFITVYLVLVYTKPVTLCSINRENQIVLNHYLASYFSLIFAVVVFVIVFSVFHHYLD